MDSEKKKKSPSRFRRQKTIESPQVFSGSGLHTGQDVSIAFLPAKEGQGVFFRRIDLPGSPVIPATVEYVFDTSRSTNLAVGDAKVYTVEHVLAAVRAFEIDNLCIDISGIEPPAGNGSSDIFVEMIEKGRIREQEAKVPIATLKNAVYWSEGETHLVALPSESYRISYTLHYPQSRPLGSQYFSFELTSLSFKKEISSCRTFALYDEISYLMDRGLIKGGSLENAVVIQGDAIISKGGLFHPHEMVRHKVLDLIGDLSLIGIPFSAHIISLRSGHSSNYAFAKKLYHHLSSENT